MEQESLLTDFEFNPVLATTGKRFLNFLIDLICTYILAFIVGFVLAATRRAFGNDTYESVLFYRLLGYLIYVLYYFTSESISKGRTIGKFITGTKTVNEDGSPINVRTALLRSLSRIVPFEPFSAFGIRPWHDKWTETYVIDIRKSKLQNPV